jgi:hypothetical protein
MKCNTVSLGIQDNRTKAMRADLVLGKEDLPSRGDDFRNGSIEPALAIVLAMNRCLSFMVGHPLTSTLSSL